MKKRVEYDLEEACNCLIKLQGLVEAFDRLYISIPHDAALLEARKERRIKMTNYYHAMEDLLAYYLRDMDEQVQAGYKGSAKRGPAA